MLVTLKLGALDELHQVILEKNMKRAANTLCILSLVGCAVMNSQFAVAAAPVQVIVPILVKNQQYCSILDIQFEIKQDSIQLEEKEKLAVVGIFMIKYPDTSAVIEGHTDDVGTSDYNQQLSQRRAESVVSYLVDTFHITPSRLTAVGYGESRPIADNSTNEGKQANRRINAVVACATDIAGLYVAPTTMTMAMEMEFDPYKDDIEPQYHEGLRELANFLKANPSVNGTVEGHASKFVGKERVTPELAMEISQRRAQNVVNYLVDNLGISRARLTTVAFGQTRRVTYGTTLDEQQENRRVNIIFHYSK
jgi:OOP family OmpA-OmpF porin